MIASSLWIWLVGAFLFSTGIFADEEDTTNAGAGDDGDDPDWDAYKKNYDINAEEDDDDSYRKGVFKNRLAQIKQWDADCDQNGDDECEFGLNDFAYYSDEELQGLRGRKPYNGDLKPTQYTGDGTAAPADGDSTAAPADGGSTAGQKRRRRRRQTGPVAPDENDIMPEKPLAPGFVFPGQILDWRSKGAVPNPISQKKCGCCYAFAAAAALESRYFIKTGQLKQFSPQHIIDCMKIDGSGGCNGGNSIPVYEYIKETVKGLNQLSDYPFKGNDTYACAVDTAKNTGLTITDYQQVPPNNPALMIQALQQGPLTIGMKAPDKLNFYDTGVYKLTEGCENIQSPADLDHEVIITGYGTDPTHGDYWIIKNSWGTTWGDGGFFRIVRGKNLCGVEMDADFPVLG